MQLDMYLLKQNGRCSYKKDIHLQISDTKLFTSYKDEEGVKKYFL